MQTKEGYNEGRETSLCMYYHGVYGGKLTLDKETRKREDRGIATSLNGTNMAYRQITFYSSKYGARLKRDLDKDLFLLVLWN